MSATGVEPVAHLDFETRSAVDLRKQGVYRYAEDATTSVLNFFWALDPGGGRGLWIPGMPLPHALLEHVRRGGRVIAHNAVFERLIWNLVLTRDRSISLLSIEQMDCTLARAAAVGLPQGLGKLADALKLPERKDTAGYAVMKKLSRPRGYAEDGSPFWYERADHPDLFAQLDAYVEQDVVTEWAVHNRIPDLSPRERRVWELDQRINDRGAPIDLRSVHLAQAAVELVQNQDNRKLWELTGGRVTSIGQHVRTARWVAEQGLPCESVSADAADALRPAASALGLQDVVRVLDIREESGKASVKKLDAMMRSMSTDNRCRGSLQYHGAGPGRWAGRLWQPQNIIRVDPDRDGASLELLFALLETSNEAPALVETVAGMLGPPVQFISKGLRGMIKAPPGRKFIGGDYSNIEGRLGAWLGGESWKLDAFRAYDAGTGPDLYKLAVANSFGIGVEHVDKTQRQLGKVQELALGFQGSVKAFLSMAAVYRVDLGPVAEVVRRAVSPDFWMEARARHDPRHGFGLPLDLWTALKVLVMSWRMTHPGVVQRWWEMQDAAIAAVAAPGTIAPCCDGRVRYTMTAGFLWCCLPAGRILAYAYPRIVMRETRRPLPGSEHLDDEDLDDSNSELIRRQRQVEFWGMISKTKRWGRKRLYGGLQFENVVQATARDIMVEGMFAVEEADYPIVLTVHDELLTEVDAGFGSAAEFREIMSRLPDFVPGLPLSASAWEDERYVK